MFKFCAIITTMGIAYLVMFLVVLPALAGVVGWEIAGVITIAPWFVLVMAIIYKLDIKGEELDL